jgi:3-methyladenine DNA glycosylase/8-oxoguanine DNA glycosylase
LLLVNIDLQSLVNKTSARTYQKGIGPLTFTLMFCLQAPDLFPLGDAVVNTIKELLDIQRRKDTKKWSPHRSMATFYCGTITSKRNRTIVYQY